MGKTRRTRDEWHSLIDDMQSSGLSQRQWCLDNDVNYNTMREMKSKVAAMGKTPDKTQAQAGRDAGWIKLDTLPVKTAVPPAKEQCLEISFGQVGITIKVSV